MQKSNTLLYHDHILNNIDSLDKRKDGYIGHRLEFINEYCMPVRKRIQAIKEDIKFYQNMRDTQYQVIEAQPDIMGLKKEIKEYTATTQYYDGKLEEFDRWIAKLEMHLKDRKLECARKKEFFKDVYNENGGALNTIRSRSHKKQSSVNQISIESLSRAEDRYSYGQSLQNSRRIRNSAVVLDNSLQTAQENKLPIIESKIRKYHLTLQEKQMKRHARNQDRLQKIIQDQQRQTSLRDSMIGNPQNQSIQLNLESVKDIKQAIIQFDHTEALFRQCFERKKLSIQKSVSQLQSKLISNKDLFLKACEVIGQKTGTLSFGDFCQLSTDQIITLFISFSWLSRKIYSEFAQKRKDIMGILKLIKTVQQQK